jgi:hypothetical protein
MAEIFCCATIAANASCNQLAYCIGTADRLTYYRMFFVQMFSHSGGAP